MTTRLLGIGVAAVLAVSVTGCDTSASVEPAAVPEARPTVVDTPTPAPTPEPTPVVTRPVDQRDLPTLAQVVQIYPHFRGGERVVDPPWTRSPSPHEWQWDTVPGQGQPWFGVYRRGCVFARPASTTAPPLSVVASFTTTNGASYGALHAGFSDPTVSVYSFDSVRRARRAFAQLQRSVARCEGRHVGRIPHRTPNDVPDVVTETISAVPLPGLGDERFAVRRTRQDSRSGNVPAYAIDTWVRTRSAVVVVTVRKTTPPPAAPALALTRAAVAASSR